MSKPKLVAVVATLSDQRGLQDPANRTVFLFYADENYSLETAQRFLDLNEGALGRRRARYELGRFKNLGRLIAWTERKRPGAPTALAGWTGPFRLASTS